MKYLGIFIVSTLLSVTALSSFSQAQDLDTAILNLRSAVQSAESEGTRLNGLLTEAKGYLDKLIIEISKANSAIEVVKEDIETIKGRVTSVEFEILNYESSITASNKVTTDQKEKRDTALAALAELYVELSKAERRLQEAELRREALSTLYGSIDELNRGFANVAGDVTSIKIQQAEATLAHTDWLNRFKAVVTEKRPDFAQVNSNESYREILNKIHSYNNAIPEMTTVRAEEKLLKDMIIDLTREMDQFSEETYNQFKEIGMGYLRDLERLEIENSLKELNLAVNNLGVELLRLQSIVEQQAYSRHRMIDFTFIAWTKLAEQALMVNNVHEASTIINNAHLAFNDNVAYAGVRSKLNENRTDYRALHRSYYAPRLARRKAHASLNEINTQLDSLSEMPVSNAIRMEIKALLKDQLRTTEIDLNQIASDIDRETRMHTRRQTYVNQYVARYGDYLSERCHELATMINDQLEPSVQHEEDFKLFRGSCKK